MSDHGENFPLASDQSTAPELNNPDFQYVLKALLEAFEPALEQQLRLAKDPQQLQQEAQGDLRNCGDEFAEANTFIGKFLTDDVARRLIPEKYRAQLGPVENWRWCLQHIHCCIVFGWLVCRGPRNFKAWAYYVHQYWLCVRQSLGVPVASPPTEEQRADFSTLIGALAKAYKPYLTDQLATAEFPLGIPDEVLNGSIDCSEGKEDACAIFDRLLTTEAAQALLGKATFAARSKDENFWLCRCWCLCSICFGCCLARARTLIDVFWCLVYYFRCLVNCFQPLTCELSGPQGCVPEVGIAVPSLIGVEIDGTAAGAGFSHYILEWSQDSITWSATNFNYPPIPPGGGTQGNIPVIGGELAFLNTFSMNDGLTFIRMTVYATDGTTKSCGPINFELLRQNVWISGIDDDFNLNTNVFDPAAEFVETVPALCTRLAGVYEVSFGGCISVQGSAFVGGCASKKIQSYSLDYKPGFETNPASPGWTNFWNVVYSTPDQYLDMNMRQDNSDLLASWGPLTKCVSVPFPPFLICETDPTGELYPNCWETAFSPPCGMSGLITLRLTVLDVSSTPYYDTQRIWVDNKAPCAMIQINAVPKCAVINLSQFALPPDCSVPWPLPISGIAYDEYIDSTLPLTRPNDNFDFYWVQVMKQGGTWLQIPVLGPGGNCFYGTQRVGNPGVLCTPCNPASPDPSAIFGTLANFDLRAVDPTCSASLGYTVPADFLLPRGQCCDYVFKLHVQDRTIFPGGPHVAEALWPVRICNDLRD
jgi:hypothetical protein